jgi:hypothetical protein
LFNSICPSSGAVPEGEIYSAMMFPLPKYL